EGIFGRQVKFADGRTLTADETYVRESILTPSAKVVAGWEPIMPTFQGQVTEEQLVQLIAYLKSLSSTDEATAPGTAPAAPAPGAPVAAAPAPATPKGSS